MTAMMMHPGRIQPNRNNKRTQMNRQRRTQNGTERTEKLEICAELTFERLYHKPVISKGISDGIEDVGKVDGGT